MTTDFQRARAYSTFLNRLYVYRNITMDHASIQLWLDKLDDWGRGCGEGWETEEDFEQMLARLEQSEVVR